MMQLSVMSYRNFLLLFRCLDPNGATARPSCRSCASSARSHQSPKKVSIAFHSDLTQPRVAGMVGEDKSNREPNRIRRPVVDLQHLRYAAAAADHGSFRRAANAQLLRQGPHPTRCPLRHLKAKLICPRDGPRFKWITEFETGCSRLCWSPAAAPARVGKWRQCLRMFPP